MVTLDSLSIDTVYINYKITFSLDFNISFVLILLFLLV